MATRKGALNSAKIDRLWPHQVAVPAKRTQGRANDEARKFCEGLSLAPLGHTFMRNDEWFNVWCFSDREDAEKFCQRFEGELIAPADRPKWPS